MLVVGGFTRRTKQIEAPPEDEKLTKVKIPAFGKDDVRVELKDSSAAQEKAKPADTSASDDGERDEKPRRARKPKADKPRDEAPRQESAGRDKPKREPKKARRSEPAEKSEPGEWNGPIPNFLHVSAL